MHGVAVMSPGSTATPSSMNRACLVQRSNPLKLRLNDYHFTHLARPIRQLFIRAAWLVRSYHVQTLVGRDGNLGIHVMNADGSRQTRLTNGPAPGN